MKSYDGNHCQIVEDAVESYRYTRLKMAWPPITLMISFLHTVDPSLMEIIPTPSMNYKIEQIGIRRASFQMRLSLGTHFSDDVINNPTKSKNPIFSQPWIASKRLTPRWKGIIKIISKNVELPSFILIFFADISTFYAKKWKMTSSCRIFAKK